MANDGGDSIISTRSRGPTAMGCCIAFMILTWVTMALRAYVRTRVLNAFGWDDITMILSLIVFSAFCAVLIKIVTLGGGQSGVGADVLEMAASYVVACIDLYLGAMILLKISLGIFFLRVVVRPWQRWVIYGVIAVSTLVNITHIFVVTFQCGDPSNYFIKWASDKCISRGSQLGLLYEQAGIACATDWIFALLPLAVLWHAKITTRAKMSVGFVLVLGTAGSICSIVRLFYVHSFVQPVNFFYNAAETAIWSTVELGTGAVACNLATLRPLFKRLLDEARGISSSRNLSSRKYGTGLSDGYGDGYGQPTHTATIGSELSSRTVVEIKGQHDMLSRKGTVSTQPRYSDKSSVQVSTKAMHSPSTDPADFKFPWSGSTQHIEDRDRYLDSPQRSQYTKSPDASVHQRSRNMSYEMNPLNASASPNPSLAARMHGDADSNASPNRMWGEQPEIGIAQSAVVVPGPASPSQTRSAWQRVTLEGGEQAWVRRPERAMSPPPGSAHGSTQAPPGWL